MENKTTLKVFFKSFLSFKIINHTPYAIGIISSAIHMLYINIKVINNTLFEISSKIKQTRSHTRHFNYTLYRHFILNPNNTNSSRFMGFVLFIFFSFRNESWSLILIKVSSFWQIKLSFPFRTVSTIFYCEIIEFEVTMITYKEHKLSIELFFSSEYFFFFFAFHFNIAICCFVLLLEQKWNNVIWKYGLGLKIYTSTITSLTHCWRNI